MLISIAKGKHLLQGIVDRVNVEKLPATLGPYVAYVKLSNVHGAQHIEMNFCNAASEEVLFTFGATSPPENDPLAAHTLILPIPPFVVKKAGRYIFRASHAGIPFATNAIVVAVPEKPKKSRRKP